jgi:hypothetical protein
MLEEVYCLMLHCILLALCFSCEVHLLDELISVVHLLL